LLELKNQDGQVSGKKLMQQDKMKLRPYYKIHPNEWLLVTNPDVAVARKKALENPKLDEYDIEEYVRQWILKELIDIYKYPIEWLGERIVVEETVQMATMEKQADISIKNERYKTFLYIETKKSSIVGVEYDKAERQLMGYLSSTHTATVGMITNGKRTKVLVKKIDPNDFDYITDIPSYDQKGLRQKSKLILELTPENGFGLKDQNLVKVVSTNELREQEKDALTPILNLEEEEKVASGLVGSF